MAEPEIKLVVLVMVWKALVEKKLVVVAEVPVAFTNEKFWRVVEPLSRRLVRLPIEPKRFEAKKAVVVALVPVAV